MRGQVERAVVVGIVVSKDKFPVLSLVLVGVHVSLNAYLSIHKLAKVQLGTI